MGEEIIIKIADLGEESIGIIKDMEYPSISILEEKGEEMTSIDVLFFIIKSLNEEEILKATQICQQAKEHQTITIAFIEEKRNQDTSKLELFLKEIDGYFEIDSLSFQDKVQSILTDFTNLCNGNPLIGLDIEDIRNYFEKVGKLHFTSTSASSEQEVARKALTDLQKQGIQESEKILISIQGSPTISLTGVEKIAEIIREEGNVRDVSFHLTILPDCEDIVINLYIREKE